MPYKVHIVGKRSLTVLGLESRFFESSSSKKSDVPWTIQRKFQKTLAITTKVTNYKVVAPLVLNSELFHPFIDGMKKWVPVFFFTLPFQGHVTSFITGKGLLWTNTKMGSFHTCGTPLNVKEACNSIPEPTH